MRRSTRTPQIPPPDKENILSAVEAVKEVIEVREGRRGDPMDKAVTFRDLEKLQLAQRPEDAQWTVNTSINSSLPVIVPPWVNPVPWAGDNYDPNTDFSTPPAPRNLIVSGAYSSINLSWVYPSYRNHGYTEIYRSSVNSLSTASLVGANQATVYNDSVGTEKKYYYWVRNVSKANVKSEWNSLTGTYGETAVDVARRIAELETEVLGDSLTQTLSERVFALEQETGNLLASYSTFSETMAQKTDIIANAVSGNVSSIQVQQTLSDGLKAQYTVKIDNNGFVSGFGLASEARDGNPRSTFSVLADRFAIINPNVQKFTISSVSVATTTVKTVSTLTRSGTTATAVTSTSHNFLAGDQFRLTSTVAGWTGNYKVLAVTNSTTFTFVVDSTLTTPAVGTHTAQRFNTATVNTSAAHGLAVGESFVITSMTGDLKWNGTWKAVTVPTTTSVTFYIPPNYSTTPTVVSATELGRGAVPFVVEDGKTYIDTALIRDATITNAKIESLAADKITTGSLTATVDVTTGAVKSSASFGQAGFYLGSDGGTQKFYVGDGSNKYLSWDGSALSVRGIIYADSGTFNGTISATAGFIGGITIQSNNLRSSNYVANTSGWTITEAGVAEFNSITARGISIYNNAGNLLLSSGAGINGTYIQNATIQSASIANAAITTAKISDLSVDTIKIAGNAITVPVISSYDPAVSIPAETWFQVATVTAYFGNVSPSGSPTGVLISFQTVVNIPSGSNTNWQFRIRRGIDLPGLEYGSVIKTYSFDIGNNITPVAIPIQHIDLGASWLGNVYSVDAWHDTNTASGNVQNTSIVVYGAKR